MEPRAPASEQRTAPRCAAACDIDGACQRVLAQHQEAPDVMVPDLLAFVNQSLLPRLRTLIEQAQTQTPGAGKKLKSKLSKDSGPGSKAKPRKEGRRKTKGRSEAEEQDVEIEGDGDGDDEGPAAISSGQQARDAGELLLQQLMDVMQPETFPPKVKASNGKTLCLETLARERKLVIMAGSVCKDWSFMNQNRRELVGQYILPFAVMLSLVRRLCPAVFLSRVHARL